MPECSITGCVRPKKAHGWCLPHYKRWRRWGDPEGSAPDRAPGVQWGIEDVEWLVRAGETLAAVAGRLGTTPAALERRLYRLHRNELVSAMKRGRTV